MTDTDIAAGSGDAAGAGSTAAQDGLPPSTTTVASAGAAASAADGVARYGGAGLPEFDAPRVERAVRELLIAIGEDPERDGLLETPARVGRAYAEMFAGLRQDPSTVLATTFDLGHDEMVLVKDIEVFSCCEHHLVPFHGKAHVGYIPSADGRITGLSKLARLVDVYARRPQVQERLTTQVADALVEHLQPRGVIVVMECEHLCMSMRGVRKAGARTTTSAVRGQLRDPATRSEAISLILG
jgi:GTP cyclohydrolase IA